MAETTKGVRSRDARGPLPCGRGPEGRRRGLEGGCRPTVDRSIVLFISLLLSVSAAAEIVDRIAVAIGNRAIKESQIERDIRLTAFENGSPIDFSGASKRQAAERLIDQTMIRTELVKGPYPAPSEAEINRVTEKIRKARFRSNAEYEQALKTYGVSEPELRSHVAFEIQALHFASLRFGERANNGFFAWLDNSRKSVRIQFHDEVFQ